ncbi:hypothetical protein MKK68_24890 [Methylobacterium sp. E-016]|uniref:hypothetical protein n=1 Tax=Methylobacterium sp. E-016 TaxID=2836556 RepID=UPI001FBAC816|nr:hypothetical protein [Methylobacterium sp. E-016]MCJ2078836.1 hypothetical protein [Methylobacterium sp. E-016]
MAVAQAAASTKASLPMVNVIDNGEPVTAQVQQRPNGSLDVILDKTEVRSAGRSQRLGARYRTQLLAAVV